MDAKLRLRTARMAIRKPLSVRIHIIETEAPAGT